MGVEQGFMSIPRNCSAFTAERGVGALRRRKVIFLTRARITIDFLVRGVSHHGTFLLWLACTYSVAVTGPGALIRFCSGNLLTL